MTLTVWMSRPLLVRSFHEGHSPSYVTISSSTTVQDVKEQLHILRGISPNRLNLFYQGRCLNDGESVEDMEFGLFWGVVETSSTLPPASSIK